MKIFYSLTLLSALIIMASSESQAIDKNTVGLWTFESGKGQKVIDISDNGFDGKIVGKAKWIPEGRFGGALSFDGKSSYVEIPKQKAFDLTEFTIELWFWAESIDGTRAVFAGGESFDTDKAQYVCEIIDGENPNKIQLWYEADDDADTYVGSKTEIKTKQWYFFAVSRDKSGNIKIYINGKLETQRQQPIPPANINHPITIGCRTNSPNTYQDFFHGKIDEVRISNLPRGENEIMNAFKKGFPVSPQEKMTTVWAKIKSISSR